MARSPSPTELGTSARAIAFRALAEADSRGEFVADRLDRLLTETPPRERALATELALGTTRRQATLDALLAPHLKRPRNQVEDPLWLLMRLGAYQLTFLAGMAEHASLNETVELAKRIQPRWSGILNAMLRKVAASLSDAVINVPTADGIPLGDGRYRLLKGRLFPDPGEEPAAYFALAFSFPEWLAARWGRRFEPSQLFSIGDYFNRPPRVSIRVNLLRITRDRLLADLHAAGIDAQPGAYPAAIVLGRASRVSELPGFAEGHFTVQDETAMRAGQALRPAAGSRVLDLCAAPGAKTTHLAELMGNRGTLIATDVSAARLERVGENARRLGATIIETRPLEAGTWQPPAGPFDAILVDAPCSNTGVLGRRPEARWRMGPGDIDELADKQAAILSGALDRLASGGRLLYSTCSIEPAENDQLLARVLRSRTDTRLVESRLFLPGEPADGGFQALIAKWVAP